MSSVTPSNDSIDLVKRIVITGGPCSGKTSAMARLQRTLKDLGYRVYIAPEAATMLFLAGLHFSDLSNPILSKMFQVSILNTQIYLENSLERYARATGIKSVILCDRGAMDGRAYIGEEAFQDVLAEAGLNVATAGPGRYDAVFHLVTAADGAESYYTLANNETRTETPEAAREMDKKTQMAWSGHHRHYIIDNSGVDFEGKMDRLVSKLLLSVLKNPIDSAFPSTVTMAEPMGALASVVPSPIGVYHFELNPISADDFTGIDSLKIFRIEKFILETSADAVAIASLEQHQSRYSEGFELLRIEVQLEYPVLAGKSEHECRSIATYLVVHFHQDVSSSRVVESSRLISVREFEAIRELVTRPCVMQTRFAFVWKNQVMQIFQHLGTSGDDGSGTGTISRTRVIGEWSWTLTLFTSSDVISLPIFLGSKVSSQILHGI